MLQATEDKRKEKRRQKVQYGCVYVSVYAGGLILYVNVCVCVQVGRCWHICVFSCIVFVRASVTENYNKIHLQLSFANHFFPA